MTADQVFSDAIFRVSSIVRQTGAQDAHYARQKSLLLSDFFVLGRLSSIKSQEARAHLCPNRRLGVLRYLHDWPCAIHVRWPAVAVQRPTAVQIDSPAAGNFQQL